MERDIPVLSLSEVVNEYMLASMNDRRKYFINYLSHAKWVWKKLLWRTIWSINHKYVEIDTTTTPHSIIKPKDFVRLINVSEVDDCNRYRSLVFDDNMNIVQRPKDGNCCKACGEEDTYGQCVSNVSVIQKDVVIDNVSYTEKIWKRLCPNGDIVEVREFPVKDYDSAEEGDYTVKMITQETFVCKLDKKPCGCVEKTPKNENLIITHCGCFIQSCQRDMCDSTLSRPSSKTGLIKEDKNRIYVKDYRTKNLILSYQTNGECKGSELMVPEYAVEAVIFGIDDRAKALAPNVNRLEKQSAKLNAREKEQELAEFLNPILVREFMDVQMSLPQWGSAEDVTGGPSWGIC